MLKLVSIAYVAPELGTMELGMDLQLTERLPDDFSLTIGPWTSMRELAKIYTVLEHFVNRLHKVAFTLTIRTAKVKVGGDTVSLGACCHPTW